MNILWQNEHYPDPVKGGGGAINTGYIVRALEELGHNAVILARGPTDGSPYTEEVNGTKVQRLPHPSMPGRLWPLWPLIEPRYTFESIAAIAGPYDAFVGVDFPFALNVKSLFPEKKLVYRVEGSEKTHDEAIGLLKTEAVAENKKKRSPKIKLQEFGGDFMERRVWKKCDAIVVKSKFMKGELEIRYRLPGGKIHIIPNGVDFNRYSAAKPSEDTLRRLKNGKPPGTVIVSCGRLVPMKNIEFLLQAFAAMRQRSSATLAIVGDGDAREALEREASCLGITSQVRFLGYTNRVEEFLAASDIFVLPSVYEPFGNSLVEAMAAGVPCVALKPDTKVLTASDEIVEDGDSGFLVSGDSPAELAAKLDGLVLNQELRRRIGRQGQARCKARYDWKACALKYLDLLGRSRQRMND
jgi:glycosyltransferase involved in cell wall biosynthesis